MSLSLRPTPMNLIGKIKHLTIKIVLISPNWMVYFACKIFILALFPLNRDVSAGFFLQPTEWQTFGRSDDQTYGRMAKEMTGKKGSFCHRWGRLRPRGNSGRNAFETDKNSNTFTFHSASNDHTSVVENVLAKEDGSGWLFNIIRIGRPTGWISIAARVPESSRCRPSRKQIVHGRPLFCTY